jgi:hypothetical protein
MRLDSTGNRQSTSQSERRLSGLQLPEMSSSPSSQSLLSVADAALAHFDQQRNRNALLHESMQQGTPPPPLMNVTATAGTNRHQYSPGVQAQSNTDHSPYLMSSASSSATSLTNTRGRPTTRPTGTLVLPHRRTPSGTDEDRVSRPRSATTDLPATHVSSSICSHTMPITTASSEPRASPAMPTTSSGTTLSVTDSKVHSSPTMAIAAAAAAASAGLPFARTPPRLNTSPHKESDSSNVSRPSIPSAPISIDEPNASTRMRAPIYDCPSPGPFADLRRVHKDDLASRNRISETSIETSAPSTEQSSHLKSSQPADAASTDILDDDMLIFGPADISFGERGSDNDSPTNPSLPHYW